LALSLRPRFLRRILLHVQGFVQLFKVVISVVKMASPVADESKGAMSQKSKIIAALTLVTLVLAATAVFRVSFGPASARESCCRDAAIKNMRQIEEWKKTWAVQTTNLNPTQEVLWGTSPPIRSFAMTNNTNGSATRSH